MKTLVEIHILQNFAPSNLNRDDTGSPKDAMFGGVRRARISSQCLKRAVREHFRASTSGDTLPLAVRTTRVTEEIAKILERQGRPRAEAKRLVETAFSALEIQAENGETEYLLYLGWREIENIAALIDRCWDMLTAARAEQDEMLKKAREAKNGRPSKEELKRAVKDKAPEVEASLKKIIDGGKAVDLALFGRMIADRPDLNVDAAAQVAHAISTHEVDREFDFYTAVDDLQPEDTQGAGMMGTVEFASACYYRYAVVDLNTLCTNLREDTALTVQGLERFLRACIFAVPRGKQNAFAAHNLPGFVAFVVRQNASPRSLANAFEAPVRPGQRGLTAASLEALAKEWAALETVYGHRGEIVRGACVTTVDGVATSLPWTRMNTVEDLVRATMKNVTALWGGSDADSPPPPGRADAVVGNP